MLFYSLNQYCMFAVSIVAVVNSSGSGSHSLLIYVEFIDSWRNLVRNQS